MDSENINLETLNEIEEIIRDKEQRLDILKNEIETLKRIQEDISNTLYNDYILVDAEGKEPEKKIKQKISKVGVGMLIGKIKNIITVLAVVKDSSSYNSGIKIKDIITSIDNKNITGMALSEIKNAMIGEEGSNVLIEILREKNYIKYNVPRMPIPGTEESIFVDIKETDYNEKDDKKDNENN